MSDEQQIVNINSINIEASKTMEEKRKQLEKQIIYYPLHEQLDLTKVESDTENLDLSQSRLDAIGDFSNFTNLISVCFRQNLLKSLASENLNVNKGFGSIKELDFYDNQIEKIENLNDLITLETLDISFNHFKKIENIEKLINLKKLFVCHNKIIKIENLETFEKLEMLELGDNQIRYIENIDVLKNLKELYLGKNKLKKIENLNLPKLEILSIQSNRFTKLENLQFLPNLQELYLSDNGLKKLEGLDDLVNLKVIDISNNMIERIENISSLINLEELWISNNNLSHWEDIDMLKKLPKLKCLYLEHNPLYYIANKKPSVIVVDNQVNNADYRRKIIMTLPNLEQLDASICKKINIQ